MDAQKSFSEFFTDKDGDYSKARFLSLARELLEQGRRPDRVFTAMLRAANQASLDHSLSEHYDFLCTALNDLTQWKAEVEAATSAAAAAERAEAVNPSEVP